MSISGDRQPLGLVLLDAQLISQAQLEGALLMQTSYPELLLGEILALRGWLKPKTLDFFESHWVKLNTDHPLGYYLQQADLLTEQQIQDLLKDQWQTGVKLGALAVMRGWLKQETLDVFLQTLAPDKRSESPFVHKTVPTHTQTTHQETIENFSDATEELKIPDDNVAYQSLDDFADAQGLPTDIWDKDEISWI